MSFARTTSYPSGGPPSLVALGDMNGDGHLDIVVTSVANGGAGPIHQVNVLLNQGAGTFGAPASYRVSGDVSPYLAVGDVSGDGKPDVVITNTALAAAGPASLDVLLNNGDGTLGAPSRNPIAGSPMGLALADVDGDGRKDLVAAFDSYPIGGGVAVFLNHGDGTFAAAATYSAGEQPTSVAVGDLNGDGRADLAVVSSASEVPGLNANLSVLLNQGGGTFAPAIQHSAGEFLMFVTGADLDGDGRFDLVVLDSSSNIGVLINDGVGNFGRVSYGAQHPSSAIALGDVTGDGRIDIVAANPLAYGSAGWVFGNVSVLVNAGDAVFGPAIDFADEPIEGSIAVGDLNGDGKLDVVAVNHSYGCTDSVSVLLNTSP